MELRGFEGVRRLNRPPAIYHRFDSHGEPRVSVIGRVENARIRKWIHNKIDIKHNR
jgi:hypothetical protein